MRPGPGANGGRLRRRIRCRRPTSNVDTHKNDGRAEHHDQDRSATAPHHAITGAAALVAAPRD
jgi:hypothetical protein